MKMLSGSLFYRTLRASLVVLVANALATVAMAVPPERFEFDPFRFTGFAIAECPGFSVLWDGTIATSGMVFFDRDGLPKRVFSRTTFTDTVFYNSVDPSYFVAGGPVEFQNEHDYAPDDPVLKFTGVPVNITVPGYGVIWHWPGHIVRDLSTGEFLFEATSPHHGREDVSALCEFLAQD
jgi:hypothetical protein